MSTPLQLKVLWQKSFLGLSIDQVNEKVILPLTAYYFWPKTEAWEQLKLELDCKPWIENEEKIKILNLTTDIMKYWQGSRNDNTFESVKTIFNQVKFVNLNI